MNGEMLFVGTAEYEHTEMHLKAIWHIIEYGERCRVNSIAKMLNIKESSVVHMLKKLNSKNLVVLELLSACSNRSTKNSNNSSIS